MRLLLIRHGETFNNVSGALDTGFPGATLTQRGLTQAQAIPSGLENETVSVVGASRLVRTQLTAEPLSTALQLTTRVVPGVEEVFAGEFEMSTAAAAMTAYRDMLISWIDGDLSHALPGSPDGGDFLAGFDAGVRALAESLEAEGAVALVSHGAAIRTWVSLRTGARLVGGGQAMANTAMIVLEGDPDTGWTLADFVNRPLGGAHLAPDLTRGIQSGKHHGG